MSCRRQWRPRHPVKRFHRWFHRPYPHRQPFRECQVYHRPVKLFHHWFRLPCPHRHPCHECQVCHLLPRRSRPQWNQVSPWRPSQLPRLPVPTLLLPLLLHHHRQYHQPERLEMMFVRRQSVHSSQEMLPLAVQLLGPEQILSTFVAEFRLKDQVFGIRQLVQVPK